MTQPFDACPALSPPERGNVRSRLEPFAIASNVPLSLYRSIFIPSARLVRCLLLKLFGHWLKIQSRFNLSLISVLERMDQRLEGVEKGVEDIRQTAVQWQQAVALSTTALPDRRSQTLRDSFRRWADQHQSDEELSQQEHPSADEKSASLVASIVVQTHLPTPPARLLLVATSGDWAKDLTQLGFDVVIAEGWSADSIQQAISFDAILARTQSEAEACVAALARLLRPRGHLIVMFPLNDFNPSAICGVAQRDLHFVEQCYGFQVGTAWSLTLDGERARQTEGDAFCLAVLRKKETNPTVYDDV